MPAQRLNPDQQSVVDYASTHPLLVIAGAGTGKTSTIAHRVGRLIAGGADPQRVLLLTFSRRAAADLEHRVALVVSQHLAASGTDAEVTLPWAGTFHSVGARLLRLHAEQVSLPGDFTVHDRGDTEDLMGLVRSRLAIDLTQRRFPSAAACAAIYSRVINAGARLADVLREAYPRYVEWEAELKALFGAYVDAKQAQHILDFDDLILYWAEMLEDAALAAEIGGRFDHVLVDEYQDTNRLQALVLSRMKPDGRGVMVVGDDAQAIYGFRAADVRNILDFPGGFTPPAAVATLATNYRSLQPVLDASNAVMAEAPERYTKDLRGVRGGGERPVLMHVKDEAEQARFVADEVLLRREEGVALKAQAVLFRSSSHSALLELELARRNVPFVKYGGLKFLDAAHVKDVLSVLRFVHNPRDRLAGFRAVRLVAGIGPATAARVLEATERSSDPWQALRDASLPNGTGAAWSAFVGACGATRSTARAWPQDLDEVLAWYEAQLARLYDDAALRAGDLPQLSRIAATFPTRERFLTEITLDPPSAVGGRADVPHIDDDYLVLSTIHSAKGQEWRIVHILNGVDGCIPSDMGTGSREHIEEERRLLYVAMTRARDRLCVIVPQRFDVTQQPRAGDRHVYAVRSRFLTASVCDLFTHASRPVAGPVNTAAGAPVRPVDLKRRIRDAWNAR